jgi:hypothetical protein
LRHLVRRILQGFSTVEAAEALARETTTAEAAWDSRGTKGGAKAAHTCNSRGTADPAEAADTPKPGYAAEARNAANPSDTANASDATEAGDAANTSDAANTADAADTAKSLDADYAGAAGEATEGTHQSKAARAISQQIVLRY